MEGSGAGRPGRPVHGRRQGPTRPGKRAPAPTGRTVRRDRPAVDPVGLAEKKSGLEPGAPERLALVDRPPVELSLTTQCDLLSLNRTSLYYQPLPPSPEELYAKRRIDELYTACPFYGSRKITAVLRDEMVINRKAVQRHMQEMGIAGVCPGPNTSKRAAEHRVFPRL
ncbi:MAG: transposase [Anaerolineales bacterium]|nr:transposase [Anaerolineales bacterium]